MSLPCPSMSTAQDILIIKNIIAQCPEVYEDELQEWIQYLTGRVISISAISRTIKKMGWTRKKVHLRNEKQIGHDMVPIANY